MSSCHPVDALFQHLQEIAPYPEGVAPVPKRMAGTAFFPGGSGLWGTTPNQPLPPMPTGQVMILGHDFDNEAGFQESLFAQGENLKGPTWRNLLWLLRQVNLPAEACFFTNVYMGLRAGDAKVTGRFPGSRHPHFVEQCQTFFIRQLQAQRPRLILTLGIQVPSVLAPLSPDLASWRGCQRFQDLDAGGHALMAERPFRRRGEPPRDHRGAHASLHVASVCEHKTLWRVGRERGGAPPPSRRREAGRR